MRFDRDHLVFKAICALDEIVDQCSTGPIRTTLAMRFVLAFLYSQSKTDERRNFDDFWKIIRDEHLQAYSDHDRRYMRVTYARTCLTGIARSCGLLMDIETQNMIAAVREKVRSRGGPQPSSLSDDHSEGSGGDHAPT
jgi:hypothetical protein